MATTDVAAPRGIVRPSFWQVWWSSAVLAPKTTLGFMRLDFILGTIFIISFTEMVFFAFVVQLAGGGPVQIEYVVVGNAVATVTYSSVFSVCQTTDSEKWQGTLDHLLISPASRLALYVGRGVVPIFISLATVTVALCYAVFIFGATVAPGAIAPLAISVLLTAFSMVGFGLLLAGVALFLRTSIILGNIFLFLGLIVSGVNFPVSQLPPALQIVGYALPLTWGVAAVRASLAGDPLTTVALAWAGIVAASIASYGLAIGLWATFERRALRTGAIGKF